MDNQSFDSMVVALEYMSDGILNSQKNFYKWIILMVIGLIIILFFSGFLIYKLFSKKIETQEKPIKDNRDDIIKLLYENLVLQQQQLQHQYQLQYYPQQHQNDLRVKNISQQNQLPYYNNGGFYHEYSQPKLLHWAN